MDGRAGAGKTLLYRTLQQYLRGEGKIVLVIALSEIAALLHEGGRTVHSRFKLAVLLPLDGDTATLAW